MPTLSPAEEKTLHRRQALVSALFPGKVAEQLADVGQLVGAEDSHTALSAIDEHFRELAIPYKEQGQMIHRMAAVIGEWARREYHGAWRVETDRQSPHFLRIVVGDFAGPEPRVSLEPFHAAAAYIDSPTPRDLPAHLAECRRQLSATRR